MATVMVQKVGRPTGADETDGAPREQTRARYPDDEGYVERDGVRVFWEGYGDGEPTVLLLPTWTLVHSRDLEGADRLPRAPLPRRRRSTRAATGGPTARRMPRPMPSRSSPPTRSPSWTRPAPSAR